MKLSLGLDCSEAVDLSDDVWSYSLATPFVLVMRHNVFDRAGDVDLHVFARGLLLPSVVQGLLNV